MVFQPLNLLWILAITKAREIAYFDVLYNLQLVWGVAETVAY